MNNKILAIVAILVIGAGVVFYLSKNKKRLLPKPSQAPQESSSEFQKPKRSVHHESNSPSHGMVLPGVPINVVVDFNFDLVLPSSISITKDGKDYGKGETKIDSSKLSMRRAMDLEAPDGIYTINYTACWPDKSCHDGQFQFKIDRTLAQSYVDLRDRKQVKVSLEEIKFKPANILISRGTEVIWQNTEMVEHFINTDSHPAHTYYPLQNSRGLKLRDTFIHTFNAPGVYPYHCSAHASTMTGMIIVE